MTQQETIRITTAEGVELDAAEPQSYRHLFTPASFLFLHCSDKKDYRLSIEDDTGVFSVAIANSSDGADTYEQLYTAAEQLLGFPLDRRPLTMYRYMQDQGRN